MSPFRENLAREGVSEILAVRGPIGIMAFHGGALERVTDVIAAETARLTESTYYAVLHPDDSLHVPSKFIDPAHSPKLSTLWVHPEGTANRNDTFWVTMGAGARLADLAAAAGDVEAHRVSERAQLKSTLKRALETVRSGRPAVVEVAIAPFSGQVLG